MQNNNHKVAIIGAGLAGCTLAILLQKKGYEVTVYEEHEPGKTILRSINLALSFRGVQTLKAIGLWESVQSEKMYSLMAGRYYHLIGNKLVSDEDKYWWYSHKHYGADGEFNYSISRSKLNILLYNEMKKKIGKENIKLVKVGNAAENGKSILEIREEYKSGAIICADGLPIKLDLKNKILNADEIHEKVYDFSYFEITLKKNELKKISKYKTDDNDYLHIWSLGKNFMIAALPNPDDTQNCLVFFPNEGNIEPLQAIGEITIDKNDSDAAKEKKKNDSYQLWSKFLLSKFGEENRQVGKQFIDSCEHDIIKISQLRDLKCDRWVDENLLLIGDSAHAVLPFHGQGANAAMEDALILSELLPDCNPAIEVNWKTTFQNFFSKRKKDADALLQLGRLNHFSMIGNDTRQIEKHDVKLKLEEHYSDEFESEYHMVTFSNKPYSLALSRIYSEDALATYILDYHEDNSDARFKKEDAELISETKRIIRKFKQLETGNNDDYWWDYSLEWETAKGEHEPKRTNKAETLAALKEHKNQNKSLKEDANLYFPSYSNYIRPKEITSQQIPLSTNPEERVFIIVHEMYELVFKQMIFDFDVVAQTLSELLKNSDFENLTREKIPRDYEEFNHLQPEFSKENKSALSDEIKRNLFWQSAYFASNRLIISVEKLLSVLSYYLDITAFSGLQFSQFRPLLLPASGFQTEQFRTVQMILGKEKCYSPKIFGAHEYFKKYKTHYNEEAWKRTADQEFGTAKDFFVSIIDNKIYGGIL